MSIDRSEDFKQQGLVQELHAEVMQLRASEKRARTETKLWGVAAVLLALGAWTFACACGLASAQMDNALQAQAAAETDAAFMRHQLVAERIARRQCEDDLATQREIDADLVDAMVSMLEGGR
jgi:hypothetical protein